MFGQKGTAEFVLLQTDYSPIDSGIGQLSAIFIAAQLTN
jgi:hypothetical protein